VERVPPASEGARGRQQSTEPLVDQLAQQLQSLHNFVRGRIASAEVDDVVEKVVVKAITSASQFDPARGSLRSWLAGIARHEIGMHFRERASEGRALQRYAAEPYESDPWSAADDRLEAELVRAQLNRAIASLPRATQVSLMRRIVDGVSYEEIGEELAITPTAVRIRVSRGLRDLRRVVGRDGVMERRRRVFEDGRETRRSPDA